MVTSFYLAASSNPTLRWDIIEFIGPTIWQLTLTGKAQPTCSFCHLHHSGCCSLWSSFCNFPQFTRVCEMSTVQTAKRYAGTIIFNNAMGIAAHEPMSAPLAAVSIQAQPSIPTAPAHLFNQLPVTPCTQVGNEQHNHRQVACLTPAMID